MSNFIQHQIKVAPHAKWGQNKAGRCCLILRTKLENVSDLVIALYYFKGFYDLSRLSTIKNAVYFQIPGRLR